MHTYSRKLWLMMMGCSLGCMVRGNPVTIKALIIPTTMDNADTTTLQPLVDTWNLENPDVHLDIEIATTMVSVDYEAIVQSEFNTRNPSFDLVTLDVVWPGDYRDHLLDLNGLVDQAHVDLHNPEAVKPGRYKEKLYTLPYRADYGVLFYRKDLLNKYNYTSPPDTWDDLATIAKRIMDGEQQSTQKSIAGYRGQFNAREGLTCNAVEWMHSCDGGNFLEDSLRLSSLPNSPERPNAEGILTKMRSWVEQRIIPSTTLVFDEDASLKDWLNNGTIFLRSWPYVKGESEKYNALYGGWPASKYGYAPLPGCVKGKSASALGGWQLGVSKYTKNKEAAVKALTFLTSTSIQRAKAIKQQNLPTIPSLYNDTAVCVQIDCALFSNLQVIARPSGPSAPRYAEVTASIYTQVNRILAGTRSAKEALDTIAFDTAKILKIDLLGEPRTCT
ncbi:hypothetical protein DFS34DRAFT_24107 [Phlyctochytrium arcticum]|nr:hypothetical protein DFS34DRAFT_24107 [Phlyctochytrium arcticum]